jgi:phage N-6-adenine-methyltransferase
LPRPKIYCSNAEKQAAYRERKRRRQPVYFWHKSDEWETPLELFAEMDLEFKFTLDVAALPHNTKCLNFFTPGADGLTRTWTGVCWMNPPYGNSLRHWVKKAHDSAKAGATVVCLLPARTDTHWWHDFVLSYAEVRFIRGRIKFNGTPNSAPFPSAIVVFRPPGNKSTP